MHITNKFKVELLIAFLLVTYLGKAQTIKTFPSNSINTIKVEIDFTTEKDKSKNTFLNIDESNPGSPILSSKTFFIAIPPEIKILANLSDNKKSFYPKTDIAVNPSLTLLRDTILSYKETKLSSSLFTSDSYPSNEVEVVGYTWLRDYYCAVIKINIQQFNWKTKELSELTKTMLNIQITDTHPFEKSYQPKGDFDKELKKVILNYDQAQDFRAKKKFNPTNDSSGTWIDYTKEYIKLAIPYDGLFRINYDDLVKYGLTPSFINPKTFKIFKKGKELPLFVFSENDASFDSTDYIEFWCEKNYGMQNYRQIVSTGTDYLNYMDRYNDTTFIWLTWDGVDGQRVNQKQGNVFQSSDTISSSLVKLHLENDVRLWYYDAVEPRVQIPNWQENKVWTWLTIGSSGSQSVSFSAKNIIPNTALKTYVRLISNAADIQTSAHKNGVSINSTSVLDSITYDFKKTVTLNSEFSSNLLKEGNNTIRVFGMPTQASFHQSLIDWIDIDYFSYNTAINDSLMILIPDTVTSGLKTIKITNISSSSENLVLYKLSSSVEKIENYFLSGTSQKTLTFSDSVTSGDKYLLMATSSLKKPEFRTKKRFLNLRNSADGADYIIISNKVLFTSINSYKNFIGSNYGVRTELSFVDDIFDEFSFGFPKAEAIKDFLFYASNNWTAPKPSYLTLIGDANYDYKDIYTPAPAIRKKNLVPSFGNPVSDSWFTMWDTLNINIPQMYVGRIPATTDAQLNHYQTKHQNYINKPFDEWNKTYLFFSGGDPTKPSELAQIKSVNDNIFNNYVSVKPIGGVGKHFYKTGNPVTNFGPYSQEEINNSIAEGAIIISYVGHSGTQTWDNGITKVEDLMNRYSDKYPLISDFGCSTGKFAEPDVDAFGETFVCQNTNGQAINYLGNSSFGYLSTSLRFPIIFNQYFFKDTIVSVGKAHYLAKVKQLMDYGINDVNRVFTYCNLLFGDPIISLKIPPKPNYLISSNSIKLSEVNPNDSMDSLKVTFTVHNFGRVPDDSLSILFEDYNGDSLTFSNNFNLQSPNYTKEIAINIPIKNKPGSHSIKISLDKDNRIDELNETDNSIQYDFNVFSSSLKILEKDKFYNSARLKFRVLNPIKFQNQNISNIILSLSARSDFSNAIELTKPIDTLITEVPISGLNGNQRYYWKSRIDYQNAEWSETFSFNNVLNKYDWYVDSTFLSNSIELKDVNFNSSTKNWELSQTNNTLEITSAGSNEGKFASILFNKSETLPNTFFWGIATALIDTITLKPYSYKYFVYPSSTSGIALKNYIDSLSPGTVIALTICDDGAQSVIGYSGGTPVRQSIATLGSYYIDSVRYRESWCIIGKKGAPKGSVPEAYKKLYEGQARISISKETTSDSGYIIFPSIQNSVKWKELFADHNVPNGASFKIIPLGIKTNSQVDTLSDLVLSDSISILSSIAASVYPDIKFVAKLYANDQKQSPTLKSLGVTYTSPPELATNYQVVSVSRDTVFQGDSLDLNFYVYNVGESPADSFHVLVDVMREDNSSRLLLDTVVASLDSMQRKMFTLNYMTNATDGKGNMGFKIKIDPESHVRELYKDNNEFTIPFFTKPDTNVVSISASSVSVTFDDAEILNGDFVSSNPNIKVDLKYPTWFAVSDTASLSILLDNQRIPFDQLNIKNDSANRTLTFEFIPVLSSGEHKFKIFGNNVYGKLDNQPGFERVFVVSNELAIMNCYNYPNPVKDNTYFTFKLPQLPEELTIRVYTIAGRLVKEIKKSSAELSMDFNRIFWDTKDQDGDQLANGVYLYKVIAKKNGKSESITQKLAIIK